MRLAVFGLGYVGCVSAACFAARGHEVVGVDPNALKVGLVNRGETPVLEPGLSELVADAVAAGRLRAIGDGAEAVAATDLSLICVGTPSTRNGAIDTQALERVADTIGQSLAAKTERHTVVVRSTAVPGTCEQLILPRLERASGRQSGRDFGVAVNPEFLREGSSVADFDDPPKIVVGQLDDPSGDPLAGLYEGFDAPLFRVPLRVAEMVKYADNAYHAVKIGFANEIGAICRELGIDSHDVMEIFRADTKLNISRAYLSPGFSFGGSCLPKDLRALLHSAHRLDLELPLLESVLPSNERHLERVVDVVVDLGLRRVGLFGLSFKPATDDLRESPLVELAERLLGKGFDLKIYDHAVSISRLVGSNREYIERHIPHLSALLVESPDEVVRHGEVCVVGAATPDAVAAIAQANGHHVIDLVRLPDAAARRGQDGYVGVAW